MNSKTRTQTKESNGNRPEFASASTGQNGQLIRTHPILHNLNILLLQNQEKSPPGRKSGKSEESKEKIIQINYQINSYYI